MIMDSKGTKGTISLIGKDDYREVIYGVVSEIEAITGPGLKSVLIKPEIGGELHWAEGVNISAGRVYKLLGIKDELLPQWHLTVRSYTPKELYDEEFENFKNTCI